MPLTELARYEGEDLPRCKATPSEADIDANRRMRLGTWECTLPAGHEDYDNRRHQPHAWVMSGEDF